MLKQEKLLKEFLKEFPEFTSAVWKDDELTLFKEDEPFGYQEFRPYTKTRIAIVELIDKLREVK